MENQTISVAVWIGPESALARSANKQEVLTPVNALYELAKRLSGLNGFGVRAVIEEFKETPLVRRLVIHCFGLDHELTETVLFEEIVPCFEMSALLQTAKWYAQATGQCSDSVKESINRSAGR